MTCLTPSPLDGFPDAKLTPAPVSFGYRFGVLAVTLIMVLLPSLYVAMILTTAYGVGWHAMRHTAWLRSDAGALSLVGLLVYLGPVLLGLAVIVFLIKPLFAREESHPATYTLTPQSEPMLFAFVTRISKLVDAPPPARIDLDCQVNASASFRAGPLRGGGQDLVLTIGLPLVAGLTLRQCAGVIAHELGHFAQRRGMKLTWLIRNINRWFEQTVQDRDSWDCALAAASNTGSFGETLLPRAAQVGISASRGVLWALMMVGHGVSCFLLRQMEYDADSYEVRVAGSDEFANTLQQVARLAAALPHTYERLEHGFRVRHLVPDNFPMFLAAEHRPLPPGTSAPPARFPWYHRLLDTHPAAPDRIRTAQALAQPGVFHLSAPATGLFRDFASLARRITLRHYREDCGLEVDEEHLVSVIDFSSAEGSVVPGPGEVAASGPRQPHSRLPVATKVCPCEAVQLPSA